MSDIKQGAERTRQAGSATAPIAERERSNNFGGARLKLSVAGTIEGYHLYWANDEAGEIETLLDEGFEFVQSSEVRAGKIGRQAVVADDDIGNRISRYVGKDSDGSPMRAYLLKCKDAVWVQRQAAREAEADGLDASIRAQAVRTGDGRYVPKGLESSIKTNQKQEN